MGSLVLSFAFGVPAALKFLREKSDVSGDLEEMETECHDDIQLYSLFTLLTTRQLWLPLIVTSLLQVAQQLSGINAVSILQLRIFKTVFTAPAIIN
jgi:Sugar (and other) transporter